MMTFVNERGDISMTRTCLRSFLGRSGLNISQITNTGVCAVRRTDNYQCSNLADNTPLWYFAAVKTPALLVDTF